MKGRELPPTLDGLVAWSCLFRRAGTFSNYLSHVRLGCELMDVSTVAISNPVVKRAKAAIEKRSAFGRREPRFIQRDVLEKIVEMAKGEGRVNEAMLYIAAYNLLLRVPSKGIPTRRGIVGVATHGIAPGFAPQVCFISD